MQQNYSHDILCGLIKVYFNRTGCINWFRVENNTYTVLIVRNYSYGIDRIMDILPE